MIPPDSKTTLTVADSGELGPSFPVGGGAPIQVDEGTSGSLQATSGETVIPFRISKAAIVMSSTNSPGDSLLNIRLNTNIAPAVSAVASDFIYYRYDNLAVALNPTAPFSTASGSAQLYFNPDPGNLLNSSTAADNLEAAVRLSQSKQVLAKGTVEDMVSAAGFSSPVYGSWRYVKAASNTIRASQFGEMGLLVRTPPSQTDVVTWSVTISGTVHFKHMTRNISATTLRNYSTFPVTSISARNSLTGDGSTYIIFHSSGDDNNNLPLTNGTFYSDYKVVTTVTAVASGYTERYNLEFDQLLYTVGPDGVDFAAPLSLIRNTNLEDLNLATVTADITALTGSLVYNVDGSDAPEPRISTAPQDYNTYKWTLRNLSFVTESDFRKRMVHYTDRYGQDLSKLRRINKSFD